MPNPEWENYDAQRAMKRKRIVRALALLLVEHTTSIHDRRQAARDEVGLASSGARPVEAELAISRALEL